MCILEGTDKEEEEKEKEVVLLLVEPEIRSGNNDRLCHLIWRTCCGAVFM